MYALVANLTSTKSENPLPPNQSDEDLANIFADFFMEKIEKIRSSLDGHPKYEPSDDKITPLLSLTPATEDEVISIINAMKTKTCETDPIPTDLFKKIVPLIIRDNHQADKQITHRRSLLHILENSNYLPTS